MKDFDIYFHSCLICKQHDTSSEYPPIFYSGYMPLNVRNIRKSTFSSQLLFLEKAEGHKVPNLANEVDGPTLQSVY